MPISLLTFKFSFLTFICGWNVLWCGAASLSHCPCMFHPSMFLYILCSCNESPTVKSAIPSFLPDGLSIMFMDVSSLCFCVSGGGIFFYIICISRLTRIVHFYFIYPGKEKSQDIYSSCLQKRWWKQEQDGMNFLLVLSEDLLVIQSRFFKPCLFITC